MYEIIQAGFAAYTRGDYKTAMKKFRPLAEQGDTTAQYNLGVMYWHGKGVPQDDAEAVRWYRMAAKQGQAEAQYNLGVMYWHGKGVPRDDVRGHMWEPPGVRRTASALPDVLPNLYQPCFYGACIQCILSDSLPPHSSHDRVDGRPFSDA